MDIEPDYSTSNLTKYVYIKYAKEWIRKYKSLNIIKLAGRGIKSYSDASWLPSWVPNWNMRSGEDYCSDISMFPLYTADSYFYVQKSLSGHIDGEFLFCSGFVCEKIESLQPIPRINQEDEFIQLLEVSIPGPN
jgi:hypothetical protein